MYTCIIACVYVYSINVYIILYSWYRIIIIMVRFFFFSSFIIIYFRSFFSRPRAGSRYVI